MPVPGLRSSVGFFSSDTPAFVISEDVNNLNLRDFYDAQPDVLEPTLGDTFVFDVEPGVTVGSTSTGTAAVIVGTWPAGVTLILKIRGRFQGKGADGGRGEHRILEGGGNPPSQPGFDGGPALYTRTPILVDASEGELWGGGGGGGGAGHTPGDGNIYPGGGGGGGAGTNPGSGGSAREPIGFPGSAGTNTGGGSGGSGDYPGGDGGGPGLAGQNGTGNHNEAGGAPGAAVDGSSYVTFGVYTGSFTEGLAGTEDIRGPQIN